MTPTGPILSIDPGTRCGWCVMTPDGEIVECGTWDLNHPMPGGRRGILFLRLHSLLEDKLAQHRGIAVLAYERVFQHTSEAQDRIYNGIVGQIECIAASWDLDTAPVAVGTIKKHATGSGRAEKADMVRAFLRRWPGTPLDDDNTADACWIADAARLGLHTKVTARKAAIRKAKRAERKLFARGGRA